MRPDDELDILLLSCADYYCFIVAFLRDRDAGAVSSSCKTMKNALAKDMAKRYANFKPRCSCPKSNCHDGKTDRARNMYKYLRCMYMQPMTTVRLNREEYIAVVAKMQVNIDLIPADIGFAELRTLRNHVFRPPVIDYSCNLPVLTVYSQPLRMRGEEMNCKACNSMLTGQFVGTVVCKRAKFHPECAAVLIDAVGRRTFFSCMGRMSCFDENGLRRADFFCHRDIWVDYPGLADLVSEAMGRFS